MSNQKIIAVLGATGAQGGGLARAILDDPSGGFAVRALTRNPASDKAKALADRGAEVVAADLDDEASLAEAFAGAHGAQEGISGRGYQCLLRHSTRQRCVLYS